MYDKLLGGWEPVMKPAWKDRIYVFVQEVVTDL